MANRTQIHSTVPLTKCGTRHAIDRSLTEANNHTPTGVPRLTKQTASGDTGDNGLMCEQPKQRSLNDDSIVNCQAHKATFTNTPTDCPTSNFQGQKMTYTSTSPRMDIHSSCMTTPPHLENKTNLIINYLPPNMNQEEVRALFSSIGEVESCKLVREKTSGESLGYAFVKFFNPSDAGKAIKTLNGLRLQNKTVKVSLARPSSEAIKGANLYICGLPRKMTQPELEKLFSSCGRIITARILYDNKTGLSRGVAFIRYDQRTEAEIAIRKLNGYAPVGANDQITVKFANSPSSNRPDTMNIGYMRSANNEPNSRFTPNNGPECVTQSIDSCPSASYRGQGYVGHVNTHSKGYNTNRMGMTSTSDGQTTSLQPVTSNGPVTAHMGQNQMKPSQTQTQSAMAYSSRNGTYAPCHSNCTNACIYANKLAATTDQASTVMSTTPNSTTNTYSSNNFPSPLNNPAPSLNTTIRSEISIPHSLQRFAGVGRFKCHAAAIAAAAMSGAPGMNLRSPTSSMSNHMGHNFPTGLPTFGMDFMRGLGHGAHTLLAPAFAASSGALTATGWCIFVYNLSPDTEESVLWQLFGPFGAVQTVKVIRDPVAGKCKGFGFVTMSNYEDALLAIHSLNGFNLGNRVLQVSFKTTPNPRQMKYMTNEIADMVIPVSDTVRKLT